MIMAGEEYRGEIPFKNVYLTGIVRDQKRRKMSKSLGNSPDPIDLIKQYGADGVRVGMLLSSPAGNDLLFDEALCLQGRNFSNKIWNSFRLVKGWEIDDNIPQPAESKIAIEWFHSRFNKELEILNDHYSKFRLSDALMTTYKLVWDDFCSWYLEMVKPAYQKPIDQATLDATVQILEKLLKILHPFTPFITEEIWDNMGERTAEERMIIAPWPEVESVNKKLLSGFESAEKTIMEIRKIRNEKQIAPKEKLNLLIKGNWNAEFNPVIQKLANLESIESATEAPASAAGFVVKGVEFFVPLEGMVDEGEEKEKLEKELEYTKGFLNSVTKKLSNERFVSGAPEQVVQSEKNKQADAAAKIKALEEQIAGMA
jgi:valyl-tRNA synthetase